MAPKQQPLTSQKKKPASGVPGPGQPASATTPAIAVSSSRFIDHGVAVDVLKDIQEVTRQAMAEGDLKTGLKGLELQGKILGMFADKVKTEVSGGLVVKWGGEQ